MKALVVVAVLAVCAGARTLHQSGAERAAYQPAQVRADDPPPPPECPMCGGNAELHQRREKFMADFRATMLLFTLTTY